jgi:hypothetical protein
LPLRFVRLEPYVIPKVSLTGINVERVDTRVAQVIYALDPVHPLVRDKKVLVGQLVDVFINTSPSSSPRRTRPHQHQTSKLERLRQAPEDTRLFVLLACSLSWSFLSWQARSCCSSAGCLGCELPGFAWLSFCPGRGSEAIR